MVSGFLARRANLEGKAAAIIVGGGGIGAEIALALARAGVDLALWRWLRADTPRWHIGPPLS